MVAAVHMVPLFSLVSSVNTDPVFSSLALSHTVSILTRRVSHLPAFVHFLHYGRLAAMTSESLSQFIQTESERKRVSKTSDGYNLIASSHV